MISVTSLEDLAIIAESVELECKLAAGQDGKGQLPKDFWPTYSAFANTHGGLIVLGLREKEGGFELRGVPNAQRVIADLFNTLNNSQKISINLLTDANVQTLTLDGKTLIMVEVPQASRKQRPVYLNGNPFHGNTYRRLHEGDRHCDDETVKRMLAEQIEDERDNRILSGYGMEDIELESLRIYRQMLRDEKPGHPFLELDDFGFLKAIKGWRLDRQTGESGLTLAGLLMFGRWSSIQDAVPHYFVDYQERPEARVERRWVDRLVPDGTWSGNVFDFYRKVYRKLTSELKVPFALKGGQRQEDTPVHEALREALVNTLVHADYSGRISILVVKRPDMFGFRNPGGMRIPIEHAVRGGESDCRNRLMHQMFLMIGLGERAGSGVPKIFRGWISQHWRPPALYEKNEPDQTLLELRMVDLLPEAVLNELRARFGSSFNTLSYEERLIVATAAIERVVSHARIAEISGLHPHDLTVFLQHLVRDGFLTSDGRSRGTIYHLPGVSLPTPEQVFGEGNLSGLGSSSEPLGESFEGFEESSEPLSPSSEPLPANSEPLACHDGLQVEGLDAPLVHDLAQIRPDLRDLLLTISRPSRESGKFSRKEMEQTILDLCSDRYLSLKVLSELLGRSDDYLRQRLLNPLVAERRLRRAFPTKPNDPRQAYTSADHSS